MRYLLPAILLSLMTFLGGCTPTYDVSYHYTPPKSSAAKRCLNTCLRDKANCQAECNVQNQACHDSANRDAQPAYWAYVFAQKEKNQSSQQTIADFADYSACKKDCGCDSFYNQCYTNCGGKINTTRHCTAFCPS